MNRGLDGIYFRVKRDGKFENVCFTDMTEDEINAKLKYRDAEWWKGVAMHLRECIRNMGEQFDIRQCDMEGMTE